MIVLSVDPGVERTGYAIFEKISTQEHTLITAGLIHTSSRKSHEKRLKEIFVKLNSLISRHKPKVLVLERIFFLKNQKTVIQVAQAQGVVLLSASEHAIPVVFFTPLEIKQIVTGYGKADKKAVQKMLQLLLGNRKEIYQDDVADAVACGLSYCFWNKELAS